MPEIAFIMGKSASGKDKIFKILSEDKDLNLKNVVMYTTRPKRVGEGEGIEYHFVDDNVVNEMKENNKIVEIRNYNTIYGVWSYFTADDGQIRLESGEKYLIIGTIEAYVQFCKYYGKEHILPIYIEVDDVIRLERAINREKKQKEPNYEEVCRRFLADANDFSEAKIEEAEINKRYKNNDNLNDCVKEIKESLKKYLI